MPHSDTVAIVEISINEAIIDQLKLINTHAIKTFLISAKYHDSSLLLKKALRIFRKKKNPSAKFANVLIIFQNLNNAGVRKNASP